MAVIYSEFPPGVRDLLHKIGDLYEKVIPKCTALYLFVICLGFLHILLHPLPVLRRVKNAYTYKMKELENDDKNLFFVSAYYYGKEYRFPGEWDGSNHAHFSLYENQVSLVFVAPRDANWERRKIVVIRSNETDSVLETMKVHRLPYHLIRCQV